MSHTLARLTYSLRDAGFKTTSLEISANGVLEAFGGVLGNGGGKPGGNLPTEALTGTAGVVAVGVPPCNIPAARSLSRSELVAGAGLRTVATGALIAACRLGGGDRGCKGAGCLANNAASAPGPRRELKVACEAGT